MQQHALSVSQALSNMLSRSADHIKECLGFRRTTGAGISTAETVIVPRIYTAPSFVHIQQPTRVQVSLLQLGQ